MPPDAPLPNSTEARTDTGELKDQSSTTPPTDNQSTQETSTTKETSNDTSKNTESGQDDKSLLNKDQKPADKKEEAKVPEKYEDWKLPEGFKLADGVGEKVNTLFKELGMSQESGQKLVDFYAANLKEAQDRPLKVWQDQQKAWQDEIKADPEIGGKLDHVRVTVSKAIDTLGPELAQPFREAMDVTGAGNHPAFIRAFYALAQKVTEPGPVRGRGPVEVKSPTGAPPTLASAMFPNLKQG